MFQASIFNLLKQTVCNHLLCKPHFLHKFLRMAADFGTSIARSKYNVFRRASMHLIVLFLD